MATSTHCAQSALLHEKAAYTYSLPRATVDEAGDAGVFETVLLVASACFRSIILDKLSDIVLLASLLDRRSPVSDLCVTMSSFRPENSIGGTDLIEQVFPIEWLDPLCQILLLNPECVHDVLSDVFGGRCRQRLGERL